MKIMRHQLDLIGDAADGSDYIARGFGWLIVFYVPSTASSPRDDNPIYCPFAKDMKLGFYTVPTGNRTRASSGSPLHYSCATLAPLTRGFYIVVILGPIMYVHGVTVCRRDIVIFLFNHLELIR